MDLYFLPFITSFLISAILTAFLIWASSKLKIKFKGRKSSRHIHSPEISRLGGIAVILAFIVAILLDKNLFISQPLWGVIMATVIIFFFGIWDDLWELEWKTQLFFQIAVATLVFIMGVRVEFITNPLGGYIFLNLGKYLVPSLIFVIVWMLLIINSVNWTDGIDGLSGGITLIGVMTIFFLSLKPEVNQPPVGIITMALTGSILGFLIFNFYPAKILAGTTGSMFMGFMLAVLAIFAGVKIATALLVLSVPIIDTLWVIGERIKSGNPIFSSDKRHIHHKLMELGWNQRKITLVFYAVNILIALVALNTRTLGKLITISFVLIITLTTLFVLEKKLSARKQSAAG